MMTRPRIRLGVRRQARDTGCPQRTRPPAQAGGRVVASCHTHSPTEGGERCGLLEPLDRHDVRGLRSLGTLGDLKLHELPFFQGLKPVAFDRGIVDEHVLRSIIWGDEPIPFLIAKPFHRAFRHILTPPSRFFTQHKRRNATPSVALRRSNEDRFRLAVPVITRLSYTYVRNAYPLTAAARWSVDTLSPSLPLKMPSDLSTSVFKLLHRPQVYPKRPSLSIAIPRCNSTMPVPLAGTWGPACLIELREIP